MKYINLRQCYKEFFIEKVSDGNLGSSWCAVTLTMKKAVLQKDGCWVYLNQTEASNCIGELMKRLNKKIYKHAYRRSRKRLVCIPVTEMSANERIHVHMLLEVPAFMVDEYEEYFAMVEGLWITLRWAHRQQHDIQLLRTSADRNRWIGYILKTERGNNDVIDLQNVHL